MAIPVYANDLTTVAIGDEVTESWDESSDATYDDGGSMVDDINLYYNGTKCVSAQFTKTGIGSIINQDAGGITVPTDGAILVHHLWAAPPALDTFINGGVRFLVGTSLGDFKVYYSSGNDKFPAPKGGWTQYAVDPAQTSSTADVGTPGTSFTHIGIAVKATAQARGNPNAVNAIRYGRCKVSFTDGEVLDPCIYQDYADIDNSSVNKLGLLEELEKGYKQRGLQSFGLSTTACYFKDANLSIQLSDEPNVSSNFHRWEVWHSDSYQEWDSMSISALGIGTKGNFEIMSSLATVLHKNCTFEDLGTFKYSEGASVDNVTFRRQEPVYQNDSSIDNSTFDKAVNSVALYCSLLSNIDDCTFISKGTGHGLDMGNFTTDSEFIWNNNDYGYTASSSGNETILVDVDSGVTLTLNISSTATTPSVYNTGLGTVSLVEGQSTLTLVGVVAGTEVRLYTSDLTTEIFGLESATGADIDMVYGGTYTDAVLVVHNVEYKYIRLTLQLDGVSGSLPINQEIDGAYKNPG